MLDNGTSMAAPFVSGAALLVRQFYRTRFGQLRRPVLLEAVPSPGAPPNAFVDDPAIAAHADGAVAAWLPAGPAGATRAIRASRLSRDLVPVDAAPVTLDADAGDQPAPKLARHGEHTLLLHRGKDDVVRLSAFDRRLAPVLAFGTNGTVALVPASRPDPGRPPALLVVGDEVAVVWAEGGADNLRFQRFDARTGAASDPAALTLGPMSHAAPHAYLAHDGTRYAVAWVDAGTRLQLRFVEAASSLGAGPLTLLEQAAGIRDPQLIWDARRGGYVLVWCDARAVPGGDIRLRFLDAAGAGQSEIVAVPAPSGGATAGRCCCRTRTAGTRCCGRTTAKARRTSTRCSSSAVRPPRSPARGCASPTRRPIRTAWARSWTRRASRSCGRAWTRSTRTASARSRSA